MKSFHIFAFLAILRSATGFSPNVSKLVKRVVTQSKTDLNNLLTNFVPTVDSVVAIFDEALSQRENRVHTSKKSVEKAGQKLLPGCLRKESAVTEASNALGRADKSPFAGMVRELIPFCQGLPNNFRPSLAYLKTIRTHLSVAVNRIRSGSQYSLPQPAEEGAQSAKLDIVDVLDTLKMRRDLLIGASEDTKTAINQMVTAVNSAVSTLDSVNPEVQATTRATLVTSLDEKAQSAIRNINALIASTETAAKIKAVLEAAKLDALAFFDKKVQKLKPAGNGGLRPS